MTSLRWQTTGLLLMVSALCLVARARQGDGQPGARVGATRGALEKWVETRRLISKEKHDWQLGRELLADRIELVQGEIDALKTKIAEAQESVTEADEKLTELVDERELLKQASSSLVGIVDGLEARTKELLVRLPEPIRERVELLSQRIPENPAETKMGLGERFQNVVGVLNEVNKFNGEITVTSEVRTLDNGQTAEVTSLYVGIGQGYYVTATGDAAGVGSATSDGWVWSSNDAAAAQIAAAIAIHGGEDVARFIQLPIRID